MNRFDLLLIIGLQCFTLFDAVCGHGMLLRPPGRSSRWRYNPSAPKNYNDNGYFCGGYAVQHNVNGGNCGLCGDDFRDPTPRANELGGLYGGKGVIVETYKDTKIAHFGFNISSNHLGYVFFELCNLDKFGEESEKCFQENHLKFENGSDKFDVGRKIGWFNTSVLLPTDLSCEHCVLRWTYHTGNNWGICRDGTGGVGCGTQETFKSCADIRIQVTKKQRKSAHDLYKKI